VTLSNDQPITTPAEDCFGLDPFAAAIAKSIAGMAAPSGVVLAVNGAWGAGKSSAINLIRHHLKAPIDPAELVIVPFNPWWFAGSDTLALAFFGELNKAIGPSLPESVRGSLAALGRGVSAVGALAGALANLKAPGLGEVISNAAGLFGRLTGATRTVDQEHQLVATALAAQKKRFLVIIDDIDRLNPDDALTMFRLVKSVGRLPNVIYLLAYDRAIAERIVSARFPSEGPGYLEKIVQAAFDLPPPMVDVLRQQVVDTAVKLMGDPPKRQEVRFWNVFFDVVAPTIRTPRDVTRIANHLSASWPAVAGNVDRADFLALTALQLSDPALYGAIRDNAENLCGTAGRGMRRPQDIAQRYDELMGIANRPERERDRARVALRRLFPRLDSIWSNTWHGDSNDWRRDRLLASAENFRSYFAFSPSEDVVEASQIEELIARAGDGEFVRAAFRRALARKRRNGATAAALLLEELTVHARDVEVGNVRPLIAAVFSLGDELDVDSDVVRGFSIGNNQLRIHWLCNILINDRFEEAERDAIYRVAMEAAAVEWACDFTERCVRHYQPRDDGQDRGPPLVSQAAAEEFRATSLAKIAASAADGSLVRHHRLTRLLFAWSRLSPQGVAPVRAWTDASLHDDALVVALARDIPSESWSHGMGFDGMGDRVAQRSMRANVRAFESILDVPRFEARVTALLDAQTLPEGELAILRAFRDTPRGSHDDD
jgi:predicted KAP-like P-loop ATPase